MRSTSKSILFWAIWTLVVLGTIYFIIHSAQAASNTERGAGAAALLKGIKQPAFPSIPKFVSPPPKPPAVWYFSVTSTDSIGQESAYSKELVWTNTARTNLVGLAWDAPGPNLTYAVYRGRAPDTYTNRASAGTNTRITLPLVLSPTNSVVTISGVGFLLVLTNPSGFRIFKGTNMTISNRYQ
jgi:hypothetical protein